ncbi:UNVERIFIED_CONTAM: hypothetical protein FKN15_029241 [Acipenser sinensis]
MVGERDSETAQLTVFERPTFLRRPINQVVLEEEGVEFRCQVQGDPQPTVRWRKDDADLPRGRPEHIPIPDIHTVSASSLISIAMWVNQDRRIGSVDGINPGACYGLAAALRCIIMKLSYLTLRWNTPICWLGFGSWQSPVTFPPQPNTAVNVVPSNVDDVVALYNQTLTNTINHIAPLKTRIIK